MIVIFTDEEKEYIDMKPKAWSIKQSCPERLKKDIKQKLAYLYDKKYEQTWR